MKKHKIIFLLLIICFLLSSCTKATVENTEMLKYIDNNPESSKVFYEDDEATEAFIELYGLENLIEHKVYSVDDELTFEFKFSSQIGRKDVSGAHDYYSKMAFDRRIVFYAPYGDTINIVNPLNDITVRIFVEDELLQYKSFDYTTKTPSYYENMNTEVDRSYSGKNSENYISSIKNLGSYIKNVEIIKPYKGYVVYFNVQCSKNLDDDKVQEIKKVIEKEIAPDLEKQAFEVYGMNTNSLGIVLAIEDGKAYNEEFVYFNGNDKKWIDAEWQTFDFFYENNK